MDVLSIVSAIASIISLGLALGINSEKLKKWLLPFTYICIGVSVGRIIPNLSNVIDHIKDDRLTWSSIYYHFMSFRFLLYN